MPATTAATPNWPQHSIVCWKHEGTTRQTCESLLTLPSQSGLSKMLQTRGFFCSSMTRMCRRREVYGIATADQEGEAQPLSSLSEVPKTGPRPSEALPHVPSSLAEISLPSAVVRAWVAR